MLPFNNYLRFLVSTEPDDKQIKMDLSLVGFSVERDVIASVRNTLLVPQALRNPLGNERFVMKYASRFGIKEAWKHKLKKSNTFAEMLELVKENEIRLLPPILALKGYKKYDVALQELGREYSPESVKLLLHYFYNPEAGMVAWRDFLKTHNSQALEMLNHPLQYLLYKFGLTAEIPFPNILKDLMHLGYFKAKEFLAIETKDYIAMGKTMADLSIRAGEKLQKVNKGDTNSFLEDIFLGFQSSDIAVPTLEEIDGEEQPLTLL